MTAAPVLVSAETVIGDGQVISGASATGGGGAGVGALGVLHPAQHISASSVSKSRMATNTTRIVLPRNAASPTLSIAVEQLDRANSETG